jgi:hypothetical protein
MVKKLVCVDLDGVLIDGTQGWRGILAMNAPLPGAHAFLEELRDFAQVLIYTSRIHEGMDMPKMVEVIRGWLAEHNLPYDGIWTGKGKPAGMAYIDDRAVSCRPQENGRGDYHRAVERARELCGG